MYKQIYLKRGKEESLKRFHPWIFSGAIHHADEGIEEGDIVRVITSSGEFIAIGHYQIGSIAVRVLSFQDTIIDDNFWHERLKEALYMRLAIGIADNPDNDTYRLVHGEGDHLPGLIIDCYGKTAVMQAHSVGMHVCRHTSGKRVFQLCDRQGAQRCVYVEHHCALPLADAAARVAAPLRRGGHGVGVRRAQHAVDRRLVSLRARHDRVEVHRFAQRPPAFRLPRCGGSMRRRRGGHGICRRHAFLALHQDCRHGRHLSGHPLHNPS